MVVEEGKGWRATQDAPAGMVVAGRKEGWFPWDSTNCGQPALGAERSRLVRDQSECTVKHVKCQRQMENGARRLTE